MMVVLESENRSYKISFSTNLLEREVKGMHEQSWTFSILGIHFDGTVCSMIALTCVIVFLFIFLCSRNMKLRPKGKQNVLEYVIDFVNNIIKDNLSEKEVPTFSLFASVLFLFILVANVLGLATKITIGEDVSFWKSPTADPTITLTLAFIMILLTSYVSVKRFGFKKYVRLSYMSPMPGLLPIKILEEFTNVLTLGLRLYGNIFAGEVLLTLIAQFGLLNGAMFPIAIPIEMIWQAFSIFIGAIQAFIFVTLTMVYMSHKISEEH
ncbi:ATP synthase A chain [Catellicoccus marimammalium M35/04/3]|uniref:ATP synthase subunit a n=2 Tax=Catellicoccus TaxID=300418 RepID=K8Z9D8_9ENTE|nr:ATP synthase A chain [Catellicoccus marimammalium M35/04/3]